MPGLVRGEFAFKFGRILILEDLNSDERWILLARDAELSGIIYTFTNIYAPAADLPGFFVEISNEIKPFGNSYVVLCGDFNNVRNHKFDETYTWSMTQPSQAPKANDTLEEELDLMNVCRYFHPSDKELT